MAALRYLVFGAIGIVVASVLFLAINVVVSANMEAGTGFVERWLVRNMCSQYELNGTVLDTTGRPVAFAVVEVSYLDERLTTRSNSDGTFTIAAPEAMCEGRAPANVALLVMADDHRPKRHSVPFNADTFEVTLERRDFSP
ncbi:MAG TPA: carboxypeptidase-like regulatory domain-containing protein [Gammaproteobacteria bacterium]|nr:carboxypeptidase-like regulatory domain-containing protein [Gammaproteobacteria bacterium]